MTDKCILIFNRKIRPSVITMRIDRFNALLKIYNLIYDDFKMYLTYK